MSFLGAIAPRLASLAVQPAVLAAGVATGVAVGAVGVGTGTIPVTDSGPRLVALYECPDSARVVKNLPGNQNVLVVARSADGQWLEIYIGQAGAERGWARATSLQLKAAPDSLPVAECTPTATAQATVEGTIGPPSTESAAPSGEPSTAPTGVPGTTQPSVNPTLAPTRTPAPTKTPKPTPTPLTGPVLSHLQVYNGENAGGGHWIAHYGCGAGVWNTFGFTVDAADADGIASVTVHWDPTGAAADSLAMTDEDGYGTLWDGGFSVGNWTNGPIHVWFQGVDTLGNPGPIFESASEGITFELAACPAPT